MSETKLAVIIGVLVCLLIATMHTIDKTKCTYKAKALGYQCHYGMLEGCVLIKPDGKRILLEQLRDFN